MIYDRVDTDKLEHIFLDMDGVICNFVETFSRIAGPENITPHGGTKTSTQQRAFHKAILEHKIFEQLKPMPDMNHLLDTVYQYAYENPHITMSILTAMGTDDPIVCEEVRKQKQNWLIEYGIYLQPNFVERSKHKARFATEHTLLIDDNIERCIIPFKKSGGQTIHHTTAENSAKCFNIKGDWQRVQNNR